MSGAAYLPLDVHWPARRRLEVLNAGRCRIVIEVHAASDLDLPPDILRLQCDAMIAPSASSQAERSEVSIEATDLAYVIFTSGSTGTPKGVMIEHGSAVNTIQDINERFRVSASDRILALASLAFDLSVYDIFGLLAVGGCIVLPREEDRVNPARWLELLTQHGVTVWDSVPGVFQMLTDYLSQTNAAGSVLEKVRLRVALLSGDWLPVDLPRVSKRLFPALRVISLGGATEASIWSNSYSIDDVTIERRSIPYGRPLANQSFYVLDEMLQPCATGVPGSLHIGGRGVARGYWADEVLTAKKFFLHPAIDDRIYATGDMGRWLADGNLEFLGRRDGQVKIRGFRIELGEIEVRIAQHPSVRACVTIVREDVAQDRKIVAYVVVEDQWRRESGASIPSALRDLVSSALPDYMVPSAFVLLDALPLTANGKVDRTRLPPPDHAALVRSAFIEPTGELELLLAEQWRQVLGVERVGATDNFFHIGGHSLAAMQVVQAINRGAAEKIGLRDVFRFPTVRELAARLTRPEAKQGDRNPQLLKPGQGAPLFFVHHVFGDVESYLPLAHLLPLQMPVYAIHTAALDASTLESMSIVDLAIAHADAVQLAHREGPYRLAGHSAGGLFALEIAHQLEMRGAQVHGVALIDTHDISEEPLQWQNKSMLEFIQARIRTYNPSITSDQIAEATSLCDEDAIRLLVLAQERAWISGDWTFEQASSQRQCLSALFRMLHRYRAPRLATRVHLIAAEKSWNACRGLKWSTSDFDKMTIQTIAGDHGSIMAAPHAHALARVLTEFMRTA